MSARLLTTTLRSNCPALPGSYRSLLMVVVISVLIFVCSTLCSAKTSLTGSNSLDTTSDGALAAPVARSNSDLFQSLSTVLDPASKNPAHIDKSEAPYDPCLPGLYRDWLEFSEDQEPLRKKSGITGARILIDRTRFEITIQALFSNGQVRDVYHGAVALGTDKTPTPSGRFVINHLYCYPDVIFFASETEPITNLYRGFFAPLQICDELGHCERYNDLGLHGFEISAHPHPEILHDGVYGPVSGGCVRVADPCAIKRNLIRVVGVGKLCKNGRGSYHWLRKNVEVIIHDGDQDSDDASTLAGILEDGLNSIGTGLKSVMNLFQP